MRTTTQTQSVTSTQLAVATLALFAAGGIALVAAPARPAIPAQCTPVTIQMSQPCEAVVRGQARGVPGFRRMSYVCPGSPNGRGFTSAGTCRTAAKMYEDAARNCQTRNQCAASGQAYGYNASAENPPAVQAALSPTIAFAPDSPGVYRGAPQFVTGTASVVSKIVITNPNNIAMYVDSMSFALTGSAVYTLGDPGRRFVSVASEDIYGRGVNGQKQWAMRQLTREGNSTFIYPTTNTWRGPVEPMSFSAQEFSRVLIPARGSKTFFVTLDTQNMQVQPIGLLGISAPEITWTVGAETGRGSPPPSRDLNYRELIRAQVQSPRPPLVSLAPDFPTGPNTPGMNSLLHKVVISNPNDEDINIKMINAEFAWTGIEISTFRNIAYYKDSINEANLLGRLNWRMSEGAPHMSDARFTDVTIPALRSKTFYVTLDTPDAGVDDVIDAMVLTGSILWSGRDGVERFDIQGLPVIRRSTY